MLNIENMTKADAAHNLEVLNWLIEHRSAIAAIAASPASDDEVSTAVIQTTFHQEYTELISTRFLSVEIHVFTDEDALSVGQVIEPNVLLHITGDPSEYVIPDHFNTIQVSNVACPFGIAADERAWKLKHE